MSRRGPRSRWRPPPEALDIAARLEASERPVITSHLRLDGDAIGSELGLAHVLAAMGKRPRVVNESPVPKVFQFLPGVAQVFSTPDAANVAGTPLVVLDSPTRARLEKVLACAPSDVETLSIDHHQPVEKVGTVEWVDPGKSSVGEMIWDLALARRWPVTPEAATCLYVAIVTDTGRFTFSNASADSLRACAALMDAGADRRTISKKLYQSQDLGVLRLQAEAVGGLRLHHGGLVASMRLTEEMFKRHHVDPIDTQEFADVPRSVEGVAVGVLFREMLALGKVKVSLRSSGFDVAAIARSFGGGGHPEAAGCEVEGGLDGVESVVLAEVVRHLPPAREAPKEGEEGRDAGTATEDADESAPRRERRE